MIFETWPRALDGFNIVNAMEMVPNKCCTWLARRRQRADRTKWTSGRTSQSKEGKLN